MPLLALPILALTVFALLRRLEVRVVLLVAGGTLALLAGQPLVVLDTFTRSMVATMVAPICAAMGFAAVLAATGCECALVQVLVAPLLRTRWLVVPGGVVAAYVVNLAVPSQASTAAALGPILLPLLRAAGYTVEAAGAVLLLGASFGGDLLQPGAQDVQAIAGVAAVEAVRLHALLLPASVSGLASAAVACAWSLRRGRGPADRDRNVLGPAAVVHEPATAPLLPTFAPWSIGLWLRAAVPLLPIAALLLAYAGVPWLQWLLTLPPGDDWRPFAGVLPVVRALLLGIVVAAATAWRLLPKLADELFVGMGRAYASIISLTICAQVFGAGLAATGAAAALLAVSQELGALPALSVLGPGGLAAVSGSGSGPILAFAQTFLAPVPAGPELDRCAALACLAGAFGRTLSPVAAVTVCVAGQLRVSPVGILRQVAVPLAIGALVAIGLVLARSGG